MTDIRNQETLSIESTAKIERGLCLQEKIVLTERELAEKLGLSYWTVRSMRLQGNMPNIRFGGRILYSWEAVHDWLNGKSNNHQAKKESDYGKLRRII